MAYRMIQGGNEMKREQSPSSGDYDALARIKGRKRHIALTQTR